MTGHPTVVDNSSRNQFEIDLGDGEWAYAKYNLLPGAIRFYHTVVPESHGGQGLGTALIKASLVAARERGLPTTADSVTIAGTVFRIAA